MRGLLALLRAILGLSDRYLPTNMSNYDMIDTNVREQMPDQRAKATLVVDPGEYPPLTKSDESAH